MVKSGVLDSVRGAFNQPIPAVKHNLKIRVSGQIYVIDLDQKIGYKSGAPSLRLELPGFEQTEVGKDTILGKPCRIVEIQHAFRIWYWGKIALKKELVQPVPGGRVEEYAIEVDANYPIKPDEFKVPDSVTIQ